MPLAGFERMEVLAKAARTFSGMPVERSDNTGTAMLFERRGRDRGASSAAAENARDLWREKTYLSEKADRGINIEI